MNRYGDKFSLSIFGESHGELIGVVLDGVKAGLSLTVEEIETRKQFLKTSIVICKFERLEKCFAIGR